MGCKITRQCGGISEVLADQDGAQNEDISSSQHNDHTMIPSDETRIQTVRLGVYVVEDPSVQLSNQVPVNMLVGYVNIISAKGSIGIRIVPNVYETKTLELVIFQQFDNLQQIKEKTSARFIDGIIQTEPVTGILFTATQIYDGEFKNNQYHGQGLLVEKDAIYGGSKAKVYCRGAMDIPTRANGNRDFRCNTQFKSFQQGIGEEILADGLTRSGLFINCSLRGHNCRIQYRDGSTYSGDVFENIRQGYGQMIWSNGKFYSGNWLNDQFHGQGTLRLPDGRQYVGDFCCGVKEGFGEFTWPDGTKYRGEFQEGKQSGIGTLIDKKGMTQDYWWEDGKRLQKCNHPTGFIEQVNEGEYDM